MFNQLWVKKGLLLILGFISPIYADPNIENLRALYHDSVSQWPEPVIDEGISFKELSALPQKNRELGANLNDPLWDDVENEAIVTLGAELFFDSRLSKSGKTSCSSCHYSERSFTDGKALAIGEDGLMGRRRSMTLFGAVGATTFFWDGRATTLSAQVLMPILDHREMNFTVEGALARLTKEDEKAFRNAFDALPSPKLLARALSAYVASLRPPETKFDEFLSTKDVDLLDDQELWGLHLFRTKARCLNCHSGPLMTDQKFHNIGLSFAGRRNQDLGRYEITKSLEDLGKFRTPSLRGVSKAGPWMHNGLFPTLKGVLAMYSAGMPNTIETKALPFPIDTSLHIQKLDLSEEEIEALLKFLNIL